MVHLKQILFYCQLQVGCREYVALNENGVWCRTWGRMTVVDVVSLYNLRIKNQFHFHQFQRNEACEDSEKHFHGRIQYSF